MILACPVVFCSLLVVRSVAPAIAAYNHRKWWLAYGDQRLRIQTAHLSTAAMESKFKEHSVVPDVLDDVPPQLAEVVFPNGRCELGNELTPTEVQNPPRISWKAEEGALYTTVMTDPDAPSRCNPKFAQWRHWLVVNIPGTDVTQGETITAYVGAAPPKGTGLHRYIILVYKQPGWLSVDEPRQGLTVKGRNNWSVKEFANKYNLGNPIAANFFQAQWDEYVPKLYEMLG